MNRLLKQLNEKGWFLMFSWQMPDGTLHKVFRRSRMPEFVISVNGRDEDRIYGDAIVKSAWIDDFIEENNLEHKYEIFISEMEETIKEIQNRV